MSSGPASLATTGPVLIIGAGLLGGSLGMALTGQGGQVYLRDVSPTSTALGRDLGAGRPATQLPAPPQLVVVATPPDVAGAVVAGALDEIPQAIVTDVSSVKVPVLAQVRRLNPRQLARYCSVHPMAGRETAGIAAATPELFAGRPWVVVPHDLSAASAILSIKTLGLDVGAVVSQLDPAAHDQAVALVSHLPQVVSSLLAGTLAQAPAEALALAGQGLRDTTRIAASDPRLWTAILAGNAGPVASLLAGLRTRLGALEQALEGADGAVPLHEGVAGAINEVLASGNQGVARIPGKHGAGAGKYAAVTVVVPDTPGALGRLFAEAGAAGINIEDLRLEHALGQPAGLATLLVTPINEEPLRVALEEHAWRTVAT